MARPRSVEPTPPSADADGLIIIGDEAWTQAEFSYEQRRLERRRKQYRDAKRRRKLRELHPPVGYLHELACTEPHIRPRKDCRPIPVWSRKVT